MPDGKTVVISARFTEAEAAEIDAARGTSARTEWVREVTLAAARPAPASRARKPKAGLPCEHRVQPGSYCRSCDRLI